MERVECNRSKTDGEINTLENVQRSKSNPIDVPKRTTSYHECMDDDLMDMDHVNRRKSTPILQRKFNEDVTDVTALYKSINVDKSIFSNSQRFKNRRSSSPVPTAFPKKSTPNHTDDGSHYFEGAYRRETSKSFTSCKNVKQNLGDKNCSRRNLANGSHSPSEHVNGRSSHDGVNSSHSAQSSSNMSTNSTSNKKKLSGHASSAIEKTILQYNTAVEKWNSKRISGTNSHLQKKILANERKDSSESNDSMNFELEQSSEKISHKQQMLIGSKKKSLVAKFEKLSSGKSVKRRRQKSVRKKSMVDYVTSKEESDNENDQFLLNEKEKIYTKRRFSLGIPSIDNEDPVIFNRSEIVGNENCNPDTKPDVSNESNDVEATSVLSPTSTTNCYEHNANLGDPDTSCTIDDSENKILKEQLNNTTKRKRSHVVLSISKHGLNTSSAENSDKQNGIADWKNSVTVPARRHSHFILRNAESFHVITNDFHKHNSEGFNDSKNEKLPMRKRSQVILTRKESSDILFVPDKGHNFPENIEKDENKVCQKEDHINTPMRKRSHIILSLKELSAINHNLHQKNDLVDDKRDISDPLQSEDSDSKKLLTYKPSISSHHDISNETEPSFAANPFQSKIDIVSNTGNEKPSTSQKDDNMIDDESSSSDSSCENFESDFSYDDPRRISVVTQNINVPLMRKRSHLIQASPWNKELELNEQQARSEEPYDQYVREDENSVNLNYFSENSHRNKLFTLDDSESDDVDKSFSNENGHRKISVIETGALHRGRIRKRSTVAVPFVRYFEHEAETMNSYNNYLKQDVFDNASENESDSEYFESDNYNPSLPNYRSLGELRSGSLIGITDRSHSFGSSPGDYEMSRKVSFDEESVQMTSRHRKIGIVSLEELPKRRMSRVAEWFEANEPQDLPSYESCYIPEMVSRKISMFGQFLTFDDMNNRGLEVVASKETRDIISQSHGTISSCSDASPYRPPLRSDISSQISFDKIPISEEPEKNEEDYRYSPQSLFLPPFTEDGDSDSTESGNSSDESTGTVKGPVSTPDGNQDNNKQERDTSIILDGVLYEVKTHTDERKSTTFSTMFGYFNYCLYNFIVKEYSEKKWKEIVTNLNLTSKQRRMFEKPRHQLFDDLITHKVLLNITEIFNANFTLFLQRFGASYFNWCCARYGDLLKSIATNLSDFINNMDDIRRFIHKVEKIADDYPPSIYAVTDKQGTLLLYYHSIRDQIYLDHFLTGFIKQVAHILFGMPCRLSFQKTRQRCDDYSIISIRNSIKNSFVKKPSISKLQISGRSQDLILEPYLMDSIFPFHLILDTDLKICQLGNSLNRLLENYIPDRGLDLLTYFKVVKPVLEDFSFATICNNLNTAFILSTHKELFLDEFANGLVLKGQMTYLESSKSLWFIASPKVDLIDQLNGESNIYLSDIPLHDATRELLLVSEQVHEQDTLKSQLQVLTNRLKETSKQLALGKINTENVLDEIFPKDVADKLMRDQPVPAVTAEEVSILFTDIVGFTAIAGKCDPEDVTIMLNNLYLGFDFLCEKYDLYKVETIGDAYMAVSGLHRQSNDHGRFTTAMGIEMITQARNVHTPAGDEIQIRVGIHSGSVVAGVVGTRMPRYCLFGNNVTLANKMESTSESCQVHISPATYLEIKHHQEFIFFERPRDIMPPLMQRLYKGHTYFVSQRRPSLYLIPDMESEPRYQYMQRASSNPSNPRAPSRRTSHSESVISDYERLPHDLREQLTALAQIGLHGKLLCVQEANDVM